MKHLQIKVYGQVQGVAFRHMAKQKAETLNLTGFAENLTDGTVYLEVEGEEKSLDKFLKWCYQGSKWSHIEKVDFEFTDDLKNFNNFIIK